MRTLPGLPGDPLRGQDTAREFYLKAPKKTGLCRGIAAINELRLVLESLETLPLCHSMRSPMCEGSAIRGKIPVLSQEYKAITCYLAQINLVRGLRHDPTLAREPWECCFGFRAPTSLALLILGGLD